MHHHDLLQKLSKRMHFAPPRSSREFRSVTKKLLSDGWHVLVERASVKPASNLDEEELEHQQWTSQQESTFWTSQTAMRVYAILFLAIVTQRLWILHGISLLLLDQMLQIVIQWTVYTLDDPKLRFASRFIRDWLTLIVEEGENILTSPNALNYIMAFSMLQTMPTGVSYVRWIYRYKMQTVRREFLREEVGGERFKRAKKLRMELAARKRAAQQQLSNRAQQLQSNLLNSKTGSRSSKDNGQASKQSSKERMR